MSYVNFGIGHLTLLYHQGSENAIREHWTPGTQREGVLTQKNG
jgi:hypothetical protein